MSKITASADFFEPWLQFQQPIVRQLAFSIASPNILTQTPHELVLKYSFALHSDAHWQHLYALYQPRLLQLDQQPQPLIDFLARLKSTRLGLRFEHLLCFWLQDEGYHPYQLLGHSIQKIAGSTTLGELDFLLFNQHTQQVEHWEVALKYYLAEAELNLAQWFGLNRADTLQRKLQHFTQRQFQFSKANELPIQVKFAVMKGQLFLPDIPNNIALPGWINTSRRLGLWGSHIPATPYQRLQRHEWLCPNQQATSTTAKWWTNGLYYSANAAAQFYMLRQAPLLFAANS